MPSSANIIACHANVKYIFTLKSACNMKKLITKVSNYINRDNFLEKGKFARVPDFSKLTLHPYPLMFYFRTHVQLPDSSQANSPPKHYTQTS